MANDINALTIVETKLRGITEQDAVREVLEALEDMDNIGQRVMGRIKIGSGGMRAFNVFAPGNDEPDPEKIIEGVVLMSHKCNVYWSRSMEEAGEDKTPDCSSQDGDEGMRRDGEYVQCKSCPYNAFGSGRGGTGKACRNMRRLYILRENDLFPMILTLPPTALNAFDGYRTRVALSSARSLQRTMTRITLATKKNGSGVDYCVPMFEAVSLLSVADAERVRAYADSIGLAAMRAGITADDYADTDNKYVGNTGFTEVRSANLPDGWDAPAAPAAPPAEQIGILVDDDELPPLD